MWQPPTDKDTEISTSGSSSVTSPASGIIIPMTQPVVGTPMPNYDDTSNARRTYVVTSAPTSFFERRQRTLQQLGFIEELPARFSEEDCVEAEDYRRQRLQATRALSGGSSTNFEDMYLSSIHQIKTGEKRGHGPDDRELARITAKQIKKDEGRAKRLRTQSVIPVMRHPATTIGSP